MDDRAWITPQAAEDEYSAPSETCNLLSSSMLFSGLSARDCFRITSTAVKRTFARRESLFAQGQEIRNLILLESGNVKQMQISSNGDEVLLRISGAGDVVAGKELSPSLRHNYSARATRESRALMWENDQMQTYLAMYPQLGVNMGRILLAQLTELEERFREVATEKVTTRVALLLLRLCKQMGRHSSKGIQISLNREELAQMAGVSMFTISRMLSRWSERGLIQAPREAVIVCDLRRLRQRNEN